MNENQTHTTPVPSSALSPMQPVARRGFGQRVSELLMSLRAVWPILRRALATRQFFRPACLLRPPGPDILCEYEVKIPMSEGYSLTANIFRSRSASSQGQRMPVVMCAHPYGNHVLPELGHTPFGGAPIQYRLIPQHGVPSFSTITSWESPDPNFWVPAGYAVVNLNLPGFGTSEGSPSVFSQHQGKCYYEAIEWIARQPWCTGSVGLNGVSFLAISQYHVAACQAYGGPPPALKCISPWEGVVDVYREMLCLGGIEEQGFPPFWWNMEVKKMIHGDPSELFANEGTHVIDLVKNHPLFDEYWESKVPKIEEIELPVLVCGSFSDHGLHTVGSCDVFRKARSKHKWLYTHRTGKWDAYYSSEVQQLTKEFFDCFVKGESDNGFLERPPVRLEVRDDLDTIYEVRDEHEWPLARTLYDELYLDNAKGSLSSAPLAISTSLVYPATSGRATYVYTFAEDTELSGYMKLKLWVEAQPRRPEDQVPDDMGIFVAVRKFDSRGQVVPFFGSVGNKYDAVTRGQIRASRRELDPDQSTPWKPYLTGTSVQPLQPGQIVSVEIALCPSSTFFAAGTSLQLVISSDEIIPSPPYIKDVSYNRGVHVLHCGGAHDAHLLIPRIPASAQEASRA